MSELHTNQTSEPAAMGMMNRLGLVIALAVAGVVFLSIGWKALGPDDPLGAVSVLAHQGGVLILLYAAGLGVIVAAVATALVGKRLIDVGVFSASLGLALASLKGGTAEQLLLARAGTSVHYEQFLAGQFALESIGWLSVLFVALLTSGVMTCRLRARSGNDGGSNEASTPTWAVPALFDLPRGARRWFGVPPDYESVSLDGLKHTAVVAGLGLLAMNLFSAGLSTRAIEPGQVCFVVAAGFFVAVYFGDRYVPVRSALWALLGVGLAAVIAYTWAALRPSDAMRPPNVPTSHYLRVLPVQFVAVGWTAALVAFWYGDGPSAEASTHSGSHANKKNRK